MNKKEKALREELADYHNLVRIINYKWYAKYDRLNELWFIISVILILISFLVGASLT